MSKKVLWLSQSSPLPAQVRELERIWPQVIVERNCRIWSRPAQIVRLLRDYDELVIDAPEWIIIELIRCGLRPIRAQMRLMEPGTPIDPDRDEILYDRHYRFERFVRIVECRFIVEDLS